MQMYQDIGLDTWLSAETAGEDTRQRPFEFSLIRSEDNVRVVLVMLLLVTALTTPELVTNRVAAYTALIVGVLLTFWARWAADWLRLRREGQLGTGTVVIVLGDFAWLSAFVWGTGSLASPFNALLLVPIVFSVALFSRMRIAVMLVTGLVVVAYLSYAGAAPGGFAWSWKLSGMLLTIMALSWLAYAMCLVLERERRTNELVVRNLSEAVALVDGTRHVVLVNRQLGELADVDVNDILGKHLDDIARDPACAHVASILEDVDSPGGRTTPVMRELTMSVPETLDLRVSTIPCAGPAGGPVGWIVICQDTTAIKALVRLKQKGMSMLAHEIRSPIATLKVMASMLSALAEKVKDGTSVRIAEAIEVETERLLSTVGQLLHISALEEPDYPLNRENIDLRALVRKVKRVAELRSSSKGISVHAEFGDLPAEAWVDEERVEEALHHLCDNANKYTEPGGEIWINATSENGCVYISVRDDGPGIAPDRREAIFDKFTQLQDDIDRDKSERGVGLGLYVVRRVAELHGGSVEVESEAGRGSTFTLRLPVDDRSSVAAVSQDDAAMSIPAS